MVRESSHSLDCSIPRTSGEGEWGDPQMIPQGEGGERGDPLMPLLLSLGQYYVLNAVTSRLQEGGTFSHT